MTRASQHKGGLARQADAYGVANDEVGEIKHCPHCHLPLIVYRPLRRAMDWAASTATSGAGRETPISCWSCRTRIWRRYGHFVSVILEICLPRYSAIFLAFFNLVSGAKSNPTVPPNRSGADSTIIQGVPEADPLTVKLTSARSVMFVRLPLDLCSYVG